MVAEYFTRHPLFLNSDQIACYVAFKDEVDTKPLIEAIWTANKICYLPILAEGKSLQFARYAEGDKLQANQFSIFEPVDVSRKLSPEKLDLVLVPLIAFDAFGHRLGTGGGYYDRTFAFTHAKQSTIPRLVGVGYASQQIDLLPADPWDIKLNAVLTEKGMLLTCL